MAIKTERTELDISTGKMSRIIETEYGTEKELRQQIDYVNEQSYNSV